MGALLAVFLLALMPSKISSAAAPKTVKNFRLICYGNKVVFLGWDDVKQADAYNVYSYDAQSNSYTLLGRTKESSFKAKGLVPKKKYQFVVRTVRKGVESADSKPVKATAKRINVKDIHGRYWIARAKSAMTVKLTNGKKVKLKKGQTVYTTAATNIRIRAFLKNGKRFYIKGSKLKYVDLTVTKSYKFYSKEQAEAFVNSKGYTSQTKWLIWISQYTSSVHIFSGSKGKWKRQRIGPCVFGKLGHTTPGEFKLLDCDMHGRNGKPELHFSWNPVKNWGHAFHCRIDRHTSGPYSDGCVRLGDSDLYYLASHCPIGTKVVSM